MSRSLKKGPYIDEKLLIKAQKAKMTKSKEPIKTWARASSISLSTEGPPSPKPPSTKLRLRALVTNIPPASTLLRFLKFNLK